MTAPDTGSTVLRLPEALRATVEGAIERSVAEGWTRRLWMQDATLWTADPAVAASIGQRLGWLSAPSLFTDEIAELTAFAATIRDEGFTDVIVAGMGGSSLAPEVLASVYPLSEHGLNVYVLDSTDPAAIADVEAVTDPGTTLRIIATKSGTTTETLAFHAHFWEAEWHRMGILHRHKAGLSFVAVTDPGKSLEAIPHAEEFRETFLNPADVGGRYSALTYVGLVPAALLGLDLESLVADAREAVVRCQRPDATNPGVTLGAALGALALAGRDKLTFVIEPDLAPLGAWLEQLIAESTGKQGKGIVPVDGETLAEPAVYGQDRVFVRLGRTVATDWRAETDPLIDALAAAGHPVIELPLEGDDWVGSEFLRWEVATAIAGAVLGVNPFDEPNVTESKENTAAVLAGFARDGHLPTDTTLVAGGALRLVGDPGLAAAGTPADVAAGLRAHLARVPANGYHAICAYVARTPDREDALRDLQDLLRDRTGKATTLGFGPRFLHSTGQLHKGGAPIGCFLQLVAGHPSDLPIPGRKETFGTLIDAQALGDLQALESHGLPVLRVHLGDDPDAGIAELTAALAAALA
ncbi:MAG: glucose-6-phosphate isomerase [Chloroflexota bacterium]